MIKFSLTDEEEKKFIKWRKKHKCSCKIEPTEGGKNEFIFRPTGLGINITARCICGKEINLTNSNSW